MPRTRKSKKSLDHDIAREAAVLSNPPEPTDYGEGAAVKALLSDEYLKKTDREALDIGLALQQIIRGQASLLANAEQTQGEINKLKARMDATDAASRRWQEDQQKFVQEVFDKADKIRAPDGTFEANKRIAKGSQDIQKAIEIARAEIAVSKQNFDTLIKSMPTVKIMWPGQFEMYRDPKSGTQGTRLVGISIRIKTKTWSFPPGAQVDVPTIVADAIREREFRTQELQERQILLSKNLQDTELAKEMDHITRKYGSTRGEPIPIATR